MVLLKWLLLDILVIPQFIVTECMTLRYGMLAAKRKGFLNLEIEGDSKIVIDCYNKRINIPGSILLLMEDIMNLD